MYADKLISNEDIELTIELLGHQIPCLLLQAQSGAVRTEAFEAARAINSMVSGDPFEAARSSRSTCGTANHEEEQAQAWILRDIFGNPFRPIQFERTWQTEITISLAQRMYDDRDFSNMGILADALEDTGCDNQQVLDHCRSKQVHHVRGCWVADLILLKDYGIGEGKNHRDAV